MVARSGLAEELSSRLPTLMHPGDADTPPFPLALPTFQTATLPEGMIAEMAEDMGLPTPDISLHFLEAVIHLIETAGNTEIVDNTELADLRAAAAREEHKRQQFIELFCRCGVSLGRISVLGFDTDHPQVNGQQFIKAMASRHPSCTKKHQVTS